MKNFAVTSQETRFDKYLNTGRGVHRARYLRKARPCGALIPGLRTPRADRDEFVQVTAVHDMTERHVIIECVPV